jgi:hypothetical protein
MVLGSIDCHRNPAILVFEARSIVIEEHLYTLSKLSIDWLGFGRSWLIRSIFGAMVLGSIDVDDYRSISLGLIDRYNGFGEIETRSLAMSNFDRVSRSLQTDIKFSKEIRLPKNQWYLRSLYPSKG